MAPANRLNPGLRGPAPAEHCPPCLDAETWSAVVENLALSPQQARIVVLVLQGLQDKEIAAKLGLAYGTVRTYLARVCERVGAANRILLVVRVFEISQSVQKRAGK
jgi:DNA-binding NarL/FixJ family response regulator